MTAPARLLSVRLQGFKSFAERTHVDFRPGISAVVGPNGSGKSNLADALRWALGEQGRALRTRKSEDVIWAGSERRPALGMADVQLVLDNADGLLPVEFGVVELGRRLFRSGENEYVLNRQRVRLRDLVDLLDAAHLAENAFLFIGQGMVDQALALRPEERRPLFEEVAGVRRHDRRRRRAIEQLAESEANLGRVEDVVAELRPQVRRLAAQAEQQASRRDAGQELVEALLVTAHARWHAAASRRARAAEALAAVEGGMALARDDLARLEADAAGGSDRLAATAAAVDAARARVEAQRDELTRARLEAGAAAADVDGIERDRSRLVAERESTIASLIDERRAAATAVPGVDPALEHDSRQADRALESATAELAAARSTTLASAAEREAALRTAARRASDLELARRRVAEAGRERDLATAAASAGTAKRDASAADEQAAAAAVATARERESAVRTALDAAASSLRAAEAAEAADARALAEFTDRYAATAGRLAELQARLDAIEGDELGVIVAGAGGRRLDAGLRIVAELRPAVTAALGEIAGGYVVARDSVAALAGRRGAIVVRDALDGQATAAVDGDHVAACLAAGGGRLVEAVEADPSGAVRPLLGSMLWAPDLRSAVALQPRLPAGWLVVTRDGTAVVRGPVVALGASEGPLDRRAEVERLGDEVEALAAAVRTRASASAAAAASLEAARRVVAARREEHEAAESALRAADAALAAAGRRSEAAAREAAWLLAQAERAAATLERAIATVNQLEPGAPAGDEEPGALAAPAERSDGGSHLALLEQRVSELRATRERLDAAWRTADERRRDADRERSRAEAAVSMGERRLAEIEASLVELEGRRAGIERRGATAATAVEALTSSLAGEQASLDRVVAEDAAARAALGGAERAAMAGRTLVRGWEDRARAAEREELEARLALESLREQVLVELAGLGELATRALSSGSPDEPASVPDRGDDPVADGAATLEALVEAAATTWAEVEPADEVPTSSRLTTLRRRYHELGAANPYALEEHAELAARLEGLDRQRSDLLQAVDRTRALIAELDELIARQFRETFGALERAFDARFQQLFGGGFARLALTEPGDLATTGIEITARPPGKKPQALAMLSGGERALTAVALLFAMLEVRPVPFCVLDEVDAALDEANVGRFSDALRDLARTTQVIVITHNRGTIETADALYGVTVGEDSTSRVISLRLEEATAIADRVRGVARAQTGPMPRGPILPAGLTELVDAEAGS